MEITVLGSGTSQGVPMIACDCAVCRSDDPRNHRTRCSIHVEMDGLHVQVDAPQEFRLQCVKNRIEKMDFFILTHGHADHIVGMDDLRRFCDLKDGNALDVYTTDEGAERTKIIFPYAITDRPVVSGYPAFRLHMMPPVMELPQGTIRATPLPHGSLTVLGLVFEERSSGKKFVYYTDCKTVPPEAAQLAVGADVMILDGLRPKPHPTHLCIPEAVEVAKQIGAGTTYLTHLTHQIDHVATEATLPDRIRLAYDGLKIRL